MGGLATERLYVTKCAWTCSCDGQLRTSSRALAWKRHAHTVATALPYQTKRERTKPPCEREQSCPSQIPAENVFLFKCPSLPDPLNFKALSKTPSPATSRCDCWWGLGPFFCFLLRHAFHGEAWLLTPPSTYCAEAGGSKGKAHLWHPSGWCSPAGVLSEAWGLGHGGGEACRATIYPGFGMGGGWGG